MSRPNYYILLDLEESEDNSARIEAAIKEKQSQWSSQRNHPTKGREAQGKMDALRDIRKIMADPTLRAEEAREAGRLRAEIKRDAERELLDAIEIATAEGQVVEKQVADLVKRFVGRFSEEEIRDRVKVPIRKESRYASAVKPTLDASMAKDIRRRLEMLTKRDLYHFLECPRTSSLAALCSRAKNVYSAVLRNNNKTAEVTATQELAGHCCNLFRDESSRDKYNNTLDAESLLTLDPLIETAVAGGVIGAAAMEQLFRKARERGVNLEDAQAYVVAIAAKRKWVVQVPVKSGSVEFQRCGYCGTLNSPKAAACSDCSELLVVECPRCMTKNPSEYRACNGCGFTVGDAALVRRLLREADLALADGDAQESERLLNEAGVYWPDFSPLKNRLVKVHKMLLRQQEQVDSLRTACAERRFARAETLLDACRRDRLLDQEESAKFQSRIETALDAAKRHVQQARSMERAGNSDNAIDAYAEAILDCQDYQEAIDGLAKCPPDPPANLKATAGARAVVLRWDPSPSRGQIVYRIVRKVASEPGSANDADLVDKTAATTLTDAAAEAGNHYYYGVFSERGGATSHCASCTGPVIRLGEVEELVATPGDRCVSLSWKAPSCVRGVEVWRKEGAVPCVRGDGQQVAAVSVRSVNDGPLRNGVTYGYRVIVVFTGTDGQPAYSIGETTTTTPNPPPAAVKELNVLRQGDQFVVTWMPPATGQVTVYTCIEKPSYCFGEIVPTSSFEKLGQALKSVGLGKASGKLERGKTKYLIPITVDGISAIVGEAIVISWVDDVDQLAVAVEEGMLTARWEWPSGIDAVMVAMQIDRFPAGPNDPAAVREELPRHKYDREGGYRTRIGAADILFLSVYAMSLSQGRRQYASGQTDGACKKVTVSQYGRAHYRVRPTSRLLGWRRSNKFSLTITPDRPIELPELVLVAKAGGFPLSPENGITILTIPAGHTCSPQRPLVLDFQNSSLTGRWMTRLFPTDESVCDWLTLAAER